MAQVIDLSDDDDDIFIIDSDLQIKPKEKMFKCLNPECRSATDLVRASDKMRRFYGVEAYKKKTRICTKCLIDVQKQKDTITDMLKLGTNLFTKEISLSRKTVVLSESDSDKTDEENSDESEFEFDISEMGGRNISDDTLNSENQVEEELRHVILDIMTEMNINQQMSDGQKMIGESLLQAEKDFLDLDKEYATIEKEINKLRTDFYKTFTQETHYLPSLDIGPLGQSVQNHECIEVIPQAVVVTQNVSLPPIGVLVRPLLKVNERVYIMKYTKLSKWVPAVISGIETADEASDPLYKVEYLKDDKTLSYKVINGKNIAYFDECPTRAPVGTRVIASVQSNDKCFYVGIIAESPSVANKYRYLIFFDDGYAQYASHSDIRVVVQCSSPEWLDVAQDSKGFIQDYLQAYPERPMVRLQRYNFIKTELHGKWWRAQVLDVDSSLVKLHFTIPNKVEWIYRGSPRLSPLFNKKVNLKIKSEFPNKIVRRRTIPPNKTGPVVEYVNLGKENEDPSTNSQPNELSEKRAVARKSTASRAPINDEVPMSEQLVLESKGVYVDLPVSSRMIKFRAHQCSPKCIKETSEVVNSKEKSPLLKPLLTGWKRQFSLQKKKTVTRSVCFYTAPCGRRLRSLEEVSMYLRLTGSSFHINQFTTDPKISLLREWEPANKLVYIKDIANDKEHIQISCVNSISNEYPQKFIYSSMRIPTKNVLLNLDPQYLVCCSCEDDCKDKMLCECWQLTKDAAFESGEKHVDIGYELKNLYSQVVTGIFECNSRCKCKSSCLNRVVQFPIKQKLQLFKTAKRGWGVRTLNDIPKGTFICDYVGKVMTENEANEGGMTDGADDYYANLDFIDAVESMKEGYESDVEDIETVDDQAQSNIEPPKDLDYETSEYSSRKRKNIYEEDSVCSFSLRGPLETREKSYRSLKKGAVVEIESESDDSNDSQNRRPRTFEPSQTASDFLFSKMQKKSIREYYSVLDSVYVMDAKVIGNIGRYLNHSCSPNVFVQNVFVDTHDPRFPWISFFASTNIKAGMELTWDYNYEVGSVPGKMKYCYCRSSSCRGRLL